MPKKHFRITIIRKEKLHKNQLFRHRKKGTIEAFELFIRYFPDNELVFEAERRIADLSK